MEQGTHNVTAIEHGARKGRIFLRCSCGWEAPKAMTWEQAQAVAASHSTKYLAVAR